MIQNKFTKALKNLSMFSHIIIFTYLDDKVSYHVCNMKYIDEKVGLLLFENDEVKKDTIIYDIKPYFPNEDNVVKSNGNIKRFKKKIGGTY